MRFPGPEAVWRRMPGCHWGQLQWFCIPYSWDSATSHYVSGWENIPWRQILAIGFGTPARQDNDANVAAL
ncbi:MAG TPA: hypothetical protein V6D03_12460 [Candidatus Caenarcaniphilales bacterium]